MAWLQGKAAAAAAIALALLLAWQTARIEGLPLAGGGFKQAVAALEKDIAAHDLRDARARAEALAASARIQARMNTVAAAHLAAGRGIQTQIQTVIEKVPVYVPAKADAECRIPWGAVRLLDAAASGAGLADSGARVGPGQPDHAASDVTLSEAVALLAANAGFARQNAEQLTALQQAYP